MNIPNETLEIWLSAIIDEAKHDLTPWESSFISHLSLQRTLKKPTSEIDQKILMELYNRYIEKI